MKRHLILFGLVAFILNACSSSDVTPKEDFVGKWRINSLSGNFKLVGEPAESEVEDLSSEQIIVEFMADGSFVTSYKEDENDDFAFFPETSATYSIVDNNYILIKTNDPKTDIPEVKYKFELNNDQLILSMDKELIKELFTKSFEANPEELEGFGISPEEFLAQFFGEIEQYDIQLIMVKQ